jgi:capsular exopolysaccharide synthesis family protein
MLRAVDTELDQSSEGTAIRLKTDAAPDGCQMRIWSPDPEGMISFAGKNPSHGAEELRALRAQLYSIRDKKPLKCLVIASAVVGEGRSFVAANLANVLALQPQCRVLLIDADLRNPRLHTLLGTSLTPGLSEYLLQEETEFQIMQRGTAEELFFIPAGRSESGPTELLGTGRLKTLVDRCESLFEWIIIDSPAALPVSDASLIANSCDGVVIVVRRGLTPFDLACKARERFRPESLVGVVLNEVNAESL